MTEVGIEATGMKVQKNGQIEDKYCWLDSLMSVCLVKKRKE